MDAIEKKQPNEDTNLQEFVKGTDPQKIAAWIKHIQDFQNKGMTKAANDAFNAMKKVHPDYQKFVNPSQVFNPSAKPSISPTKKSSTNIFKNLKGNIKSNAPKLIGAALAGTMTGTGMAGTPKYEMRSHIGRALVQEMDVEEAGDPGAAEFIKARIAPKPATAQDWAIDPKTGAIKWQEPEGEGVPGQVRDFPYKWFAQGQNPEFFSKVKAAGLEVKDVNGVATIDPASLQTVVNPPAPTPAATDPMNSPDANLANDPNKGVIPPTPSPQPTPNPTPGPAPAPSPTPTPQPGGDTRPATNVDQAKVARFKQLVDKAMAGGGAQPKPQPKPKPPGGDVRPGPKPTQADVRRVDNQIDAANQSRIGGIGGQLGILGPNAVRLGEDDYTLSLIKSVKL